MLRAERVIAASDASTLVTQDLAAFAAFLLAYTHGNE